MFVAKFVPLVAAVVLSSPYIQASPVAWPASKEALATLAVAPDKALADTLRTESNAAFDKKNLADAVTLRRLEALVRFMAANPLPDELRTWFWANRPVAEEFIDTVSREDNPAAVARILSELWKADAKGFAKYPALACAIALVYDKPCSRVFPHHQVSAVTLPRKLHDPAEVFAFFTESAEAGRLIQSPAKLGIDELAFVVPVITPLAELREVQKRKISRQEIAKLYASIVYDTPRLKNEVMNWPHASYSLETIKKKGGICVDQAYYTSTVAQAFGVPAFIMSGAGSGGFHAFVGYLDRPGKWRTDVGRYANHKYATGTVINPLTWGELTDHDLAFLEARFRSAPAYAAVLLQVTRARELMTAKDLAGAARLLTMAKNAEPRCPEVWEALGELASLRGDGPTQVQTLATEAARALGKYRELEIRWRTLLADSLEKSGKEEEAFAERLAIVRRNAGARPELAAELAAELMKAALQDPDSKRTLIVFNRLVGQFDEAGPEFTLKVVYPVVNQLVKASRKKEASQVVRSVKQKLKGDADSTLVEMQKDLESCVEAGDMASSKFMRYVHASHAQ